METLEDIYIGSIETDRGTREQVRFYDTRGLRDGMEFPRHYYTFADGFVLVYSIDSKESFKRMEALKKDIDRHRDKKEVRTNAGDIRKCESLFIHVAETAQITDFIYLHTTVEEGLKDFLTCLLVWIHRWPLLCWVTS